MKDQKGQPGPAARLNTEQRLQRALEAVRILNREYLRTRARVSALEITIAASIPEKDRAQWSEQFEKLTAHLHQSLLESVEKSSPALAARMDDRGPGETGLLI